MAEAPVLPFQRNAEHLQAWRYARRDRHSHSTDGTSPDAPKCTRPSAGGSQHSSGQACHLWAKLQQPSAIAGGTTKRPELNLAAAGHALWCPEYSAAGSL